MSKKDILIAAQKILDGGIELVNDPFTGEQMTTAVRDRDEALLKPLEKALQIDGLIGRYAKQGAHVFEHGFIAFQVGTVAHWILLRSLQVGEPEKIVDQLYRVLKRNSAECYAIFALQGIKTTHRVNLSKGISLVPFEDVPAGNWKEKLLRRVRPFLPLSPGKPTSAIVFKFRQDPLFIQNKAKWDTGKSLINRSLVDDTLRALTLVGPSAPVVIMEWNGYKANFPYSQPGVARWSMHELNPEAMPTVIPSLDTKLAMKVTKAFLGLNSDRKQLLRIPLQRLALSVRRRTLADKAIELGIALEALLAGDRSHHDPVSHLVRLRGALLHGGTLAEKKRVYRLLRDVYTLRSKAVHVGHIAEREKVNGRKQKTEEILAGGATECAFLIRKWMGLTDLPNWDDVMLDTRL